MQRGEWRATWEAVNWLQNDGAVGSIDACLWLPTGVCQPDACAGGEASMRRQWMATWEEAGQWDGKEVAAQQRRG